MTRPITSSPNRRLKLYIDSHKLIFIEEFTGVSSPYRKRLKWERESVAVSAEEIKQMAAVVEELGL